MAAFGQYKRCCEVGNGSKSKPPGYEPGGLHVLKLRCSFSWWWCRLQITDNSRHCKIHGLAVVVVNQERGQMGKLIQAIAGLLGAADAFPREHLFHVVGTKSD